MEIINKTMDRNDLESEKALEIINELNSLIREVQSRKLKISSWFGRFDLTGDGFEPIMRGYGYEPLKVMADAKNFPWFKYWEIVWLTSHNDFRPESSVLDLGGSSSLFSFYLASKGLDVTTIANHVAREMGWKLRSITMDMTKMRFTEKFENITSVCVFEHLCKDDRIHTIRTIRDLLVEGGRFSITFDFGISHINTPSDVYEQFIKYSGLGVRAIRLLSTMENDTFSIRSTIDLGSGRQRLTTSCMDTANHGNCSKRRTPTTLPLALSSKRKKNKQIESLFSIGC
jgi:hypothetical protein